MGTEQINEGYDSLTGLYNIDTFYSVGNKLIKANLEKEAKDKYSVVYFDVLRFKAVNDLYGIEEGDKLLKFMADSINTIITEKDMAGRYSADKFVIMFANQPKLEGKVQQLMDIFAGYSLPFQIVCNFGIYDIPDEKVTLSVCVDRAILAQSKIKGNYVIQCKRYDESMREEMLSEQEISGMIGTALADGQFIVYFQPQYNHSTGTLIGAEGLVRWQHPKKGLIAPAAFIPIIEKNGYITKLDMYVFEWTCRFIRNCIRKGIQVVPISTNFSRYDIFQPDFVEQLEAIRMKYDIPTKYLRVEITETVVAGGSQYTNEVVNKLSTYGYIVEMDDFGSGYSSLNVLKDINFDIIKLDMKFLSNETANNRGGTILSSIVRMAQWLNMPVIAEGVERVEQADFLRSIGCDYIQGYLYSKPIPEKEFEKILSESNLGNTNPELELIDEINTFDFWNPDSKETLIFNNFVGAAVIFDYREGKLALSRVNEKYLIELGMNMSEKNVLQMDPWGPFDEENKKIYEAMLKRAIESGKEEECETWREMTSKCCGPEKLCIRSQVKMIGKSKDRYLFYAMIRNITNEKMRMLEAQDATRRFKAVSEQAKIYYWEYEIATHIMRPCFRCMRDLGLPAVVHNYPDSAIEMGIIPPDYADMYRDLMKQIDNGAKNIEAIIPLTEAKIPHHVRYTTEFDMTERPIKAYGSATPVEE